jgi:hypothetical protein
MCAPTLSGLPSSDLPASPPPTWPGPGVVYPVPGLGVVAGAEARVTQWTRRAAAETRAVLDVLGADEDVLVRSVGPRRPTRRLGYPALGDTFWMEHDGQFPAASWCSECGRPSALNHTFICVNHNRKGKQCD